MLRLLVRLGIGLLLVVIVAPSSHGQSRLQWQSTPIYGECYMEDCDAEWYDSTEEYVIEAIQHCETAPHDRVYETAALFVVGSGTCGGGGAACGIYPECAPTFEAVSLDGEVPNSRHIFRVTVTSKQLDYAGGFYSCKDVGVQVTEMDFTKLPEGAPPCDQQ